MRRFIVGLVILVALLAVVVVVGDVVTVRLTESAIAKRIEQQIPGSHATVTISSEPFLVQLAASGKVKELHAHVTGVKESTYTFQSIDVRADNIEVNRGKLVQGSVRLQGISNATIIATVPGDQLVKAGLVAGLHQLGVLAPSSKATVKEGVNDVIITVGGVIVTLPFNGLVTCVGSAVFSGGNLVLTCTTDQLPPALADPGS